MDRTRRRRSGFAASRAFSTLFALLLLSACEDRPLPFEPEPEAGQEGSAPGVAPSSDESGPGAGPPPPPGQVSVFLGPGTPVLPDVGAFAERTLVDITIEGISYVYWDAWPPLTGTLAWVLGPGGLWWNWSCAGNVVVLFNQGGSYEPCRAVGAPFREVEQARMVVRGTARVWRHAAPRPWWLPCGGLYVTPCYTYSGGQSVTITPVADKLQVEADTNHVAAGTPVTFTASTKDGTPLTVREWIWAENPEPSESTAATGEDEDDAGAPAEGAEVGAAGGGFTTVCGTDAVCRYAPRRSGTMYVRAVVGGVVQQAGVGVEVDEVEIRIVEIRSMRAEGPPSSFTSAGDEAKIMVTAEVSPATLLDQVRWKVEDAPGGVNSQAPGPGSLGRGGVLIWTVPPQDRSRWDTFLDHPGALNEKKLGFRVTAYVDIEGKRHDSEPEEIEQDEVDTVRQEYIDFGKSPAPHAKWGTPASDHFSSAELNWGDYSVYLATDGFLRCLEAVRTLVHVDFVAADRPFRGLVITSAYRNPVHNAQHMRDADGEIVRGADDSQHMFGTAADIRIYGNGTDPLDFYELLRDIVQETPFVQAGYFEPPSAIRRGSRGQLDHAHIDWRHGCPLSTTRQGS